MYVEDTKHTCNEEVELVFNIFNTKPFCCSVCGISRDYFYHNFTFKPNLLLRKSNSRSYL